MIFDAFFADHTFLVPPHSANENLDASGAALLSLLQGYRLPITQSELLDAAKSGTSLPQLADIAQQYGLQIQQTMLPVIDIPLYGSQQAPLILSWDIQHEATQYLLVWNQVGSYLQVMAPRNGGRQWHKTYPFLESIVSEPIKIEADVWREWAEENSFLASLKIRLSNLQLAQGQSDALVDQVLEDEGWFPLAALDAASRMVTALVAAKAFDGSDEAYQLINHYFQQALDDGPNYQRTIPAKHWVVYATSNDDEQSTQLSFHALTVLRVLAYEPATATRTIPDLAPKEKETKTGKPQKSLLAYIQEDKSITPVIAVVATVFASIGVFTEALLFRGFIELGEKLTESQRYSAIGILLIFGIILLLLYWPVDVAFAHMGRGLAARLRIAAFKKLPLLSSQYFQNFSTAGITERVHGAQHTHFLPSLSSRIIWLATKIALTIVGIAWIDGLSASIAIIRSIALLGLFMGSRSILSSQNIKVYIALEKLGRTALDAMRGLVAIRTHGAERAVRREYEGYLGEWHQTAMNLRWYETMVDVTNRVISYSLMILLIILFAYRYDEPANLILLFYWSLALDTLSFQLVLMIFMYFRDQGRAIRFLSFLDAPQEKDLVPDNTPPEEDEIPEAATAEAHGVPIYMRDVRVAIADKVVLSDVNLTIEAGSQVAIVGPSGAGKSTLTSLLLGWNYPQSGYILVDGQPLNYDNLQKLRHEIAWVDPTVALWNRSFLYNLRYGTVTNEVENSLDKIMEQADLLGVLSRLPNGLQTGLGSGGRMISGGEGQRVRFGRVMHRENARLVILDEAFRGLDRGKRRQLLGAARTYWKDATLICITHDVEQTQDFERVLVVENGRIIEDGTPNHLKADETSRYHQLLTAEKAVREDLWSGKEIPWRRFWLEKGLLTEQGEAS